MHLIQVERDGVYLCLTMHQSIRLAILNLRTLKLYFSFPMFVFLLPHVTALFQPPYKGVIKSLNTHYKTMMLRKQITCLERSKITTLKSFNSAIFLSDALVLLRMSWNKVIPETIHYSWKSAFRVSKATNPSLRYRK